MTNMKMDKEEAQEYASPSMSKDMPEYPYGLQLDLNDDALKKLGIDKLPEVGDTLGLVAKVEVCNVSAYQTMDGDKEQRVTLQITDMELHTDIKNVAKEIYG